MFSVGVIFLPAEFMTAIGSRFGVPAFVGLVVLLGTALVLRTRRDHIARLRVLCVTFHRGNERAAEYLGRRGCE